MRNFTQKLCRFVRDQLILGRDRKKGLYRVVFSVSVQNPLARSLRADLV